MNARKTVVDRIERWFGHLSRMAKKTFQWKLPRKRERSRPRESWDGKVRRAIAGLNLPEEEGFLDRKAWRWRTGIRHDAVHSRLKVLQSICARNYTNGVILGHHMNWSADEGSCRLCVVAIPLPVISSLRLGISH